jgi:hypothetical protein
MTARSGNENETKWGMYLSGVTKGHPEIGALELLIFKDPKTRGLLFMAERLR